MNYKFIDQLTCEQKIKLLSSQIGTVFFYKDNTISNSPRWYFFVGYQKNSFFFVLPQKNVTRRLLARNETRKNLKTLLIVNETDYPELSLESVFDCNTIIERDREWLISICENSNFRIKTKCPCKLLNNIVKKIYNSNLISPKIKEIIKKCNSSGT